MTQSLTETVRAAADARTPLHIAGGGTKSFYGRAVTGKPFEVSGHRGILSYEPTELVITARAGTPLRDIEAALAEKNQMLAFEPPHFGAGATLGGTLACGFSGPRRPWAGSARDFVLGMNILNGKGERLRFGGQVIKNVAGFDVSRLMVGALGSLGVLLEVSLKILPRPEDELTLAFKIPADQAVVTMNTWSRQPLPLSAACHLEDTLYVRLSGSRGALRAAHARLGGETTTDSVMRWHDLREQRHRFFSDAAPLWRLSVPPATPPLDLPGRWLIDWGGAQRWLKSDAQADDVRRVAGSAGGYATLFRGNARGGEPPQPPLPSALQTLHRRLKQAFDPHGILNPGCIDSDL